MEISLLGPPQVSVAGQVIPLGTRKQRFLLAVLAIEVNHRVGTEQLIDLMWPSDPPPTARSMIHTYVSGLRRMFQTTGVGARIERLESGYLLRCEPRFIDSYRFRCLVNDARGSTDDIERLTLLDQALALWRGPALAGVAGEETRVRLVRTLEEARLCAVEERLEALARLDRREGLLDQLLMLGDKHPMRPRIVGALMWELHREGRTVEALAFYRQHSARMCDELGLDPPQQIQQIHMAILRNDLVLPATPSLSKKVPVPRQLPGDLPTFVGRGNELARLLGTFNTREPANAVIYSIDGMAGIGKTVLAVRAAHRLSENFTDGQLYVDLHGFTRGAPPVDPADALIQLLHALGASGQEIPAGIDARAALYRTLLADKHVLVVLDNAAGEDQVQPLLPGVPSCGVIITSRHRLPGLPNANPICLDLFPTDDSRVLFERVAGIGHRAEAVDEIIDLCGGLPLAVRIAASRLLSRATWTADHLAQRLRDRSNRLVELGSGHLGVAAAIELSYRQLDPAGQRLYRLLGLHPGPDTDGYAVRALVDGEPRLMGTWLDDLVDVHLLQEPAPGRYRLHELVRAHAMATAERDEPAIEQDRAIARLLDYYTHEASRAMDVAYPYHSRRRSPAPPPIASMPSFDDRDSSAAWLDVELPNLMASAAFAAESGQADWYGHAIALSATLHNHLRTRGRYAEAERLHSRAAELAREHGNHAHEARALNCLGGIHHLHGRYEPANDCFDRALQLASGIADLGAQSDAEWGLGYIHYMKGCNERGALHYGRSLRLARQLRDEVRELDALRGLGHIRFSEAQYALAAQHFDDALRHARRIGHRVLEMDALRGLGNVHRAQGRPESALRCYEQNLRIAQETGHLHGQLAASRGLAHAHLIMGELDAAIECFRQSLDLADTIGDPNSRFEAIHGLGSTHLAADDLDQALACYETGLSIARGLAQRDDEARASNGMARALAGLGRRQEARQHWRQALAILAELNIRQVEEIDETSIRASLAELDLPARARGQSRTELH